MEASGGWLRSVSIEQACWPVLKVPVPGCQVLRGGEARCRCGSTCCEVVAVGAVVARKPRLWRRPSFLESVAHKGHYLRSLLTERLASFSQVRGAGLLVGIQLSVPAAPLVDEARKQGLIVLTAGVGDVIRLAPPLNITEQQLEKCVNILSRCMDSLC